MHYASAAKAATSERSRAHNNDGEAAAAATAAVRSEGDDAVFHRLSLSARSPFSFFLPPAAPAALRRRTSGVSHTRAHTHTYNDCRGPIHEIYRGNRSVTPRRRDRLRQWPRIRVPTRDTSRRVSRVPLEHDDSRLREAKREKGREGETLSTTIRRLTGFSETPSTSASLNYARSFFITLSVDSLTTTAFELCSEAARLIGLPGMTFRTRGIGDNSRAGYRVT